MKAAACFADRTEAVRQLPEKLERFNAVVLRLPREF